MTERFSNDDTEVTAADLADLDAEFPDIHADDLEDIPDGTHTAKVESVRLGHSRSGNLVLRWGLRVIGPSHAGRMLFRNNMFATFENKRWLKRDLKLCGVELAKLSDLPARLPELLDITVSVRKRTRGERYNVYLLRRLDDAGADGTMAPGPSGLDSLGTF
jgi:hypothetical protein